MADHPTPPWWLPGAHLQTIFPLLRKPAALPLRRERVDTPDGDFIDIDWLDGPADAPLVVLFHGLEGSSRSHYARSLARVLQQRGWRAAFPHFRGCSGAPNLLARAYHSGDSDEIDRMLRHIMTARGTAPLFAAGVSLGGNALLKWLGEQRHEDGVPLQAAVAICPPLDLTVCGHALARGFNRVYTRHFLATLKPKALAKLDRFPELFDRHRMLAATTLHAFDDVYTGPVHGFAGADDYWRRASARPLLGAIGLPTLLLTAANDPFVPPPAVPHAHELADALTHRHLPSGGHVGFITGRFPGSADWLALRVTEFLQRHT